jgi:hypothetical protein
MFEADVLLKLFAELSVCKVYLKRLDEISEKWNFFSDFELP